MKKYIIIILSFLGLFFINVGIVSAEDEAFSELTEGNTFSTLRAGNVSSNLTETEIEEINNRIKEAGLPFNNRDYFKILEGFTDYYIYISPKQFQKDKRVDLTLYIRPSDDIDGWELQDDNTLKTHLEKFVYYHLEYDTSKQKWHWYTYNSKPYPYSATSTLQGYVLYSTETVPVTVDNQELFVSNNVTSAEEAFGVPVENDGSDQDGGILGMLNNIVKSIISFPGKMIEGISNFFKGIFMPDKEVLNAMVNDTKKHIENKFTFLGESSEIKDVFQSSKSIEETEVNYGTRLIYCHDCEPTARMPYLLKFKFKVIDSEILNTGLNKFRPVIRGFLVLMLLFYNFNQFLGFIGQKSSVASGEQGA